MDVSKQWLCHLSYPTCKLSSLISVLTSSDTASSAQTLSLPFLGRVLWTQAPVPLRLAPAQCQTLGTPRQ